jgi:hypothetical protein
MQSDSALTKRKQGSTFWCMRIPLKHVSEKKRSATELLQRVNSRLYSESLKELIESIATVNRLDAVHREGGRNWIGPSDEMREMLRLQKSIRKILTSYPMTPMLRITPDGWLHSFDSPDRVGHARNLDYAVLRSIHEACETGLLLRFARCEYFRCKEWFFRRVDGQRFHSARCREGAFKSTPQWKAYRREKAREYYRLQQHKNVK